MRKKRTDATASELDNEELSFGPDPLMEDIDSDLPLPSMDELAGSNQLSGYPALTEEEEAEWIAAREKARRNAEATGRKRKSVVPPEVLTPEMSVFDYLHACRPPLDKKIVDIAIAQMQVPPELRDDAAQEIMLTWTTMKPDVQKFKPGQIAAYAHRIARHTALRVRRELGSSVRLPGSAFRKKKDGTTYVTPGLLSVPLQWEELEGWLDADDAADAAYTVQGMGSELQSLLEGQDMSVAAVEDEETEIRNNRLAMVNAKADKLSSLQREALILFIMGNSYETIQNRLNLKRATLLNAIEEATAVIWRK